MGFKVRGYTREVAQEKVRDYSLFAIATEGKVTEPGYFRPFNGIDRIKVDIIEPTEEGESEKTEGSSPRKVLEKVEAYVKENQLCAEDGDSLWCVIDVDRWPQDQIAELYAFCSQHENWHLVMSNPCIEIWLLYHKFADLTTMGITNAREAKQVLDKKAKYYYFKYLPLMPEAIKNAKNADTNPDGYLPDLLETKVYQLGQALYDRIGKPRFDRFVASLPQMEKKIIAKKK